jgi:hypothetical protein
VAAYAFIGAASLASGLNQQIIGGSEQAGDWDFPL